MNSNERELRQEIDRLRRELAEVSRDRDQLHRAVCEMLPFEEVQWTEQEMAQLLKDDVTIVDLLRDPEGKPAQGPPSDAAALAQDRLGVNR